MQLAVTAAGAATRTLLLQLMVLVVVLVVVEAPATSTRELRNSTSHGEGLVCFLCMEIPAALSCSWDPAQRREWPLLTTHLTTHQLGVYTDGFLIGSCHCAPGQCAGPPEDGTQPPGGPSGGLGDPESPGFGEKERGAEAHGTPSLLSCQVPLPSALSDPLATVSVWLQQETTAAVLASSNLTSNLTSSPYTNLTTRVFHLSNIGAWCWGLLVRWSSGYNRQSPLWEQLHYQVQQQRKATGGAVTWQLLPGLLRSPELRLGPRPPRGGPSLAVRVRSAPAPDSFFSGTWSPWSRALVVPEVGPARHPTTALPHPERPAPVKTGEHVRQGVRYPRDLSVPIALGVMFFFLMLGAALIVIFWSRLRGSVWPPVPDPGGVVRRLLKEVGTVIDSPTQGTMHNKGGSMGTLTGKVAVLEAQPPVVVVTSPDPEQTQLDPEPAQCDPDPGTPAEAPPGPPGAQCLLPSAPASAPSTWTPGPLLTPGIDYISLE
ncbi:unnamed protein product [Lampetra planeri]